MELTACSMTDTDMAKRRARMTLEAATAGASVAAEHFRTDLTVEYKTGKTDTVTQADRDAQTQVIELIQAQYPDEPIVGEEADALKTVPETGPAWIVDPIDGTNNYVRGNQVFGTAVAALVDGQTVGSAFVAPALEDTYRFGPDGVFRNDLPVTVSEESTAAGASVAPTLWWDRDQARVCLAIGDQLGDLRRYGCAQAALAMVASGELEGTVSGRQAHPWDTVAGVAMVRAAGGTVTDIDGDPWQHDSTGLVASNGRLHEEILAVARVSAGE